MNGIFISFEGPEACGKSTQVEMLVSRFEQAGHRVLKVREPGGTRTGEVIRQILQHDLSKEQICSRAEALLFAASRAQLMESVIAPALCEGKVVIADRFADSTTVYQGYARGLGTAEMISINSFAVAGRMPDMTFLIDVDVELGFSRLEQRNVQSGRGYDRLESEGTGFHERVREGYARLAERWPERVICMDGSCEPENLHSRIWAAVTKRFGVEDQNEN
jgi:dTMP kinase